MLTFNDVEKIVKKYNYRYENNILFGINKVKVKSVIPLGPLTVYTYNEVHNFLFRFSDEGINIMKLKSGKTDEVICYLKIDKNSILEKIANYLSKDINIDII